MRAEFCFIKIQRAFHRDRDKILKLPTPHGLGGFGLEKATQYLTQVKSSQVKSSHDHVQAQVFADMKGILMADMKGTLKFTIFPLSCTLWVTDKPSSLHDLLSTLTIHTWFKSMEHQAMVSQARHRNLPQAVRPLRTPLPTVLSRCPLPAPLQRLAQQAALYPALSTFCGRCPSRRSLP